MVFEVVAATVRFTEGVMMAEEGGRWMRNGIVERVDYTIVQFLGKITVRIESGEDAETFGELAGTCQWRARAR